MNEGLFVCLNFMFRGDRIPGNCRTLGMEYQSTAKHLLTEECQGGVRSSEKWDYHWISTYCTLFRQVTHINHLMMRDKKRTYVLLVSLLALKENNGCT